MESLDGEDRDKGRERYSYTKEVLLKLMKGCNGRAWRVNGTAALDIRFEWISALLTLDSKKKDEFRIKISGEPFLIGKMYCLGKGGYSNFEDVQLGRKMDSFRVTGKESSNVPTFVTSDKFVFCPAVLNRK